jgi:dihydrofolate reductase
VIDFNDVLFNDKYLAIAKAKEAAERGVLVGIHTYDPTDPRLKPLLDRTNVIVAKTHRRVLARVRRLARLRA